MTSSMWGTGTQIEYWTGRLNTEYQIIFKFEINNDQFLIELCPIATFNTLKFQSNLLV